MRPFKVIFKTDANEATTGGTIGAMFANTNEQATFPGGIVGFQLTWLQTSC
jgi:hypothetical protein